MLKSKPKIRGKLGIMSEKNELSDAGQHLLKAALVNSLPGVTDALFDPAIDINARDRDGRTALMSAVSNHNLEIARLLVQRGIDANAADKEEWTALHFAAQVRDGVMVGELVAAGAALEAKDVNGNTPLWRAVMAAQGRGDAIEALLKGGADPDQENNKKVSPRALASRIANYDLAKYFRDIPLK